MLGLTFPPVDGFDSFLRSRYRDKIREAATFTIPLQISRLLHTQALRCRRLMLCRPDTGRHKKMATGWQENKNNQIKTS
jgi:hypothetical protein